MYQQGVFFNGGMNTDDEDRLVPNGDYRYASFSRNYGVNVPNEGALQSMTGNILRDNSLLATGVNIVIGSCEDVESKSLILFVWNDNDDHSIWRYKVESFQYQLILQDSILSFKKTSPIYHASVVNDLLYWTDNYFLTYRDNKFNPPRKINIQKAILYTSSGGTDPDGYSEITFNNLDWIKHPPLFSPIFTYDSDTTENSNNLKNKLFQFRYQYVYDDNEESAWSPISEMTLPNYSEYINQTVNINPYLDNVIKIDIETGSSITRLIRVAYRIGNTGEFFLYKEYDKNQLGWSDYSTVIINFKNETSGRAISNSERNYDLVPQIVKTIEYLPSNEFAIGNYIEGYDKQEIEIGDVSFSVNKQPITETAFTYPLPEFFNDFNPSTPSTQKGFYIFFNPRYDSFIKYRYEPGDTITLQLKDEIGASSQQVAPDRTIYFRIPDLDSTIYQTDLQKINQLCVLLKDYLETFGIISSVKPPGSSSGPFPSIGTPCLKVLDKTWYNRTATQMTQTTGGAIILFRDNKSTRTFKSGANHEFAFQYYDRANRDGTVLTVPAGEVYVPFNTDLTDGELNGPQSFNRQPYFNNIQLTISSTYRPPIWADTYQVVYKPSTNISNFQQRSVKEIIYNADTTAKLVLEDYYKFNFLGASINQTPSQGDFVRFVRQRALFDSQPIVIFSADTDNVITPLFGGILYILELNNYVDEIYDPSGALNLGVFTAPTSNQYLVSVNTTVNVNYTGYPDATTAFISVRAVYGGGVGSDEIASATIYPNSNNFTVNLSGTASIYYAAGQIVEFIVRVQLVGTTPPNINITNTLSNYQISYLIPIGDYDETQYYPKYVTREGNLNQELNVMSYDPAGGPNGEDVVVVNNFDSNLLGDYLLPPGTDALKSIRTGGFQIEIYTPKKQSENDPWYEVGIEFPIIDPHTPERSHGGDVNQVYPTIDGEVTLNCGDVYIRQRVMSTGYQDQTGAVDIGDANDNIAAWFCEDPHYSDFYTSNWNNKGRLGLFSAFAKRQHLKSSIYHTNAFIDNTQINGLSRVEFFNNVSLKDEHGGINRLMQIGDTLKTFQDKKISSVYIQKAFALNGDGTNNVIISDKTFAGVRPHDDDYGCVHPGSVSKVENNVFFYDFYNAAVVQATQGGLVNVCDGDHKFAVGIRKFTNKIRGEELGGKSMNIISHINRSNGEYILYAGSNLSDIPNSIQFTDFDIVTPSSIFITGNYAYIFDPGVSFIISGALYPGNNGTYTVQSAVFGGGQTLVVVNELFSNTEVKTRATLTTIPIADISAEAIVYSYNRQRWSSYMEQPVLWATQFGNRAYTVGGYSTQHMGKLYEEDKGSELTFFNVGLIQQIHFLFNSNPTIVKRFLTFMTQSNMPFDVSVEVPETNQYPTGMASNILIDNFRNQESYYVSKYFRDILDPNPYVLGVLKRINGRELRGYVLKHSLTNGETTKKMILFSANVNFIPSEPIMQ